MEKIRGLPAGRRAEEGVKEGMGGSGTVFGFEDLDEVGGAAQFGGAEVCVGAFLGLEEDGADIGERGGALRRDAARRECVEEIAEDVIEINFGEVIENGRREFVGEVFSGAGRRRRLG
jgi:hypothetical protein